MMKNKNEKYLRLFPIKSILITKINGSQLRRKYRKDYTFLK